MDIGEQLVALYPKMERYAYSLTQNRDNAEDLVMEVITRLLKKRDAIPADVNFESYVIRSIRNHLIDESRKNKRMVSDLDATGKSLFDEISDEGSEDVITSEVAKARLMRAIASLGPNCQNILTLFGIGYSYKEIAEISQIPVGTVMSRMARCRTSLSVTLSGATHE
jgi:RNA polymerase sigma-70 factor, ECF subfamily